MHPPIRTKLKSIMLSLSNRFPPPQTPLSSDRQINSSDLIQEPETQCPFSQCFHVQHWAQSSPQERINLYISPAFWPILPRSAHLTTIQRERKRKGKPQGAIQHPLGVLSRWVGVLWNSSNKHWCVCQQRFPKELRRSERAGIPTCGPLLFLLLHSHLSILSLESMEVF